MNQPPVHVHRAAWVALAILAAAVVPLRVAEIHQQQETLIFQAKKASGAVLAPLQPTSRQ